MASVRLGIVGCGGFVRGVHIPNIRKNSKFQIKATMDIDESAAQKTAEETGADYHTTDVERILADGDIDAVFVTTRHDSHAPLSIEAAEAGKHVLCEKPMALNIEDCRAVAAAVRKAGVKYTIGYNRGLAPMISKAKELLAGNPHKKMLYHRIQAPFPEDSWTHDPDVGGGRFVGEGCHIFDLFCELVEAPPVSVYATGGTFLDPQKVHIPDSALATITFADGSCATTLINSAGCPTFEKEATEIYCDGKAIYIVNFQRMDYCGFEGRDRETIELDVVDKGHAIEIDLFADAILNDSDSPNGVVKATRAALISYKVNESLKTGEPVAIAESELAV